MLGLQRALSLIYPDQCILCPELVDASGGLCAACWRGMPFLRGLVCDACGARLVGAGDGARAYCDDCLALPRPWQAGRAAIAYRDMGRRLVLSLKHGDRPDLAKHAAVWLESAGRPLFTSETVLVPIPIHWSRLLRRRYNQSAELARALGGRTGLPFVAEGLVRVRRTPVQDGLGVGARFDNLQDAIGPHPRGGQRLKGRDVCLIDDVMTSGATLSAAAGACHGAGATQVTVLVLARVEKAP